MTNKVQASKFDKRTKQATTPIVSDDNTLFYMPKSNSESLSPQHGDSKRLENQGEMPQTWNDEKTVWQAAAVGDIPALQSFLANGLNVDSRENEDYTPLIYAAQEGQNETIEFLLNNGADVNAVNLYGVTPLIAASASGHIGTVKLLLERGANAKARANTLTSHSEDTALTVAIRKGHVDIAELLERASD